MTIVQKRRPTEVGGYVSQRCSSPAATHVILHRICGMKAPIQDLTPIPPFLPDRMCVLRI